MNQAENQLLTALGTDSPTAQQALRAIRDIIPEPPPPGLAPLPGAPHAPVAQTYYIMAVKLLLADLLDLAQGRPSLLNRLAALPAQNHLFSLMALLDQCPPQAPRLDWCLRQPPAGLLRALAQLAETIVSLRGSIQLPALAGELPGGDMLGGLYANLVPPAIRHGLGEYYTPSWLVQALLDQLDYHGQDDITLLDPTCGSGAFLLEALARGRARLRGHDAIWAFLSKNLMGVDIHPLAVLTAQANMLLALADLLPALPPTLPIRQADCLLMEPLAPASLVVGNPPWVRWSHLPKAYRRSLEALGRHYLVAPSGGRCGSTESDLASLVLMSTAHRHLAPGGRVGFILPEVLLKSEAGRGLRLGLFPGGGGLRVESLELVGRPFRDAQARSVIYIASRVDRPEAMTVVPCRNTVACPVGEAGSPWFVGPAASLEGCLPLRGSSPYLDRARRGVVTDLARVFWLRVEEIDASRCLARVSTLTLGELPRAREVPRVEGQWMEADLLHPLVRGRDCGRYGHRPPYWALLVPQRHYAHLASEAEFAQSHPLALAYLERYRGLLEGRSTFRRYQGGLPFYALYCLGDYTFGAHKVAWPEQQEPGRFRAAVLTSGRYHPLGPELPLVADHKLYFVPCPTPEEAHYLCAFLNAPPTKRWLGGFAAGMQLSTALFRYTRIPLHRPEEAIHRRLAEISITAHAGRRGIMDSMPLDESIESELESLVMAASEANSREGSQSFR